MYGLGTHSLDQTLLLFGKPKSVTAFLRVLREGGTDDAIDDSFTIILQYSGEQKNMIATVKTTVISSQPKQLKYWVRGTNGTFTKVPILYLRLTSATDNFSQEGEDVQMDHLMEDKMAATDSGFGVEPEAYHGTLYTTKPLDNKWPKDKTGKVSTGKIESKVGSYMDYYRDLAAAIRGEREVEVKPEQSRAGIRIIELAQESAKKGVTVAWSEGP